MVSEVFFVTDWRQISEGSAEIGFCLLDDHPTWKAPTETKRCIEGEHEPGNDSSCLPVTSRRRC